MSVVDLDRARFGHQRADTWGHEVTRSPVKCIPPGERLRQSNEWTDLPSEDPEIRDTVVEHIAWKDRRALHDVQQAEALRQESSRLFDSYHQVQRDCLALEAEKEKVYNAVCVEKYDSAKSHEVCAQIEREVRKEAARKNEADRDKIRWRSIIEKQRVYTNTLVHKIKFFRSALEERQRVRESLPCCTKCCTACCWYDNYWTRLFLGYFPGCKCYGERCCDKVLVLRTLDVDRVYRKYEEREKALKAQQLMQFSEVKKRRHR